MHTLVIPTIARILLTSPVLIIPDSTTAIGRCGLGFGGEARLSSILMRRLIINTDLSPARSRNIDQGNQGCNSLSFAP